MKTFYTLLLIIASACHGYSQTTVNLAPDKDNSIYSESGALSNATGVNLFAGVTSGNNKRRSLMHFDLSAIPVGATITSVSLSLTCNNVAPNSGNAGINLHRLLADWGEATSGNNPNGMGSAATTKDATWTHRFYTSTPWSTAGGDFAETVSANAAVPSTGLINISSTGLIADVQGWVNDPASNFGWLIAGSNETSITTGRRFASRQNTVVTARPQLTITYTGSLPVLFTGFTATVMQQSIVLKWKTATEINNSHFLIEHGTNGQQFSTIGKVQGSFQSTATNNYEFIHTKPANGVNYYRLAQVDVDGAVHRSPVVTVNAANYRQITVYPNPAHNLLIVTGSNSLVGSTYQIISSSGVLIEAGILRQTYIPLRFHTPGQYMLIIQTGDHQKMTIPFTRR